ncbi:MAG: AI-2E family transporter [Candidatus Paceibacterota bacterium]|jgi:predicted PurR-regulated permease PerM
MPANKDKLQSYFLFAVLAIVFVLTFFIFRPFLAPLILAIVFAVVSQPFYRIVLRTVGGRLGIAAFFTTITIIACLLIPLTFLGTQILNESRGLYLSLADGSAKYILDAVTSAFSVVLDKIMPGTSDSLPDISSSFDTYAKQGLEWIIHNLGGALSSVTDLLLGMLIFFVALYYFLRDGEQFKKTLFTLSPLAISDDEDVSRKMEMAVNSVIKGSLSVALVQGILTAVGFALFGVPNSVLWGTVAAVAALIPAIGTALVIIPGIIFLFLTGSVGASIGLFLWGLIAVGLIDNFLSARLMGRGMQLHPLLVLLSVLGGIGFFGAIGLFLGPLTLSLLFAFLSIYSSRRQTN